MIVIHAVNATNDGLKSNSHGWCSSGYEDGVVDPTDAVNDGIVPCQGGTRMFYLSLPLLHMTNL